MNIYEQVKYRRSTPVGQGNWLGNLRWYVKENDTCGSYSFECISALPSDTHSQCVEKNFTTRLFDVQFETSAAAFEYGADYIKSDDFTVFMPFFEYGCILKFRKLHISAENAAVYDDIAIIRNGSYYIAVKSTGKIAKIDTGICIGDGEDDIYAAIAFNIDESVVCADCDRIYKNRESIIAENRDFWEKYFASCPTVEVEDYAYHNAFSGRDYLFKSEDITVRQLWHWWCVLINVNEVEFNKNPLYMAPDKTNWKGIWSNDALQSIAALSLTNQKEFAKRLFVSYLTSSVNADGVFSWYTHADGLGCYGLEHDVGRLSHGAPYFPHAAEYLIRATGDEKILDADAGGMTVYEKLKKYVHTLINRRINPKYGMIEWANLWETGWDDKGGCFFEAASLEEWMKAVSEGTAEEIAAFYEKNQRPVIPIVEQVITLWSLYAGIRLAGRKNDGEFAEYCTENAEKIRKNLFEKCWCDKTGFYYDIDVKRDILSDAKSADVFYMMYFEKDSHHAEKVFAHLNNTEEFDCCYMPMLSRDSAGFDENGYWSGGHWPREMSMVAMGLDACGYGEKAKELLVRAIMSEEGNIIAEVINPLTGIRSTGVTKMACAIMNNLALLHISGKVRWSEEGE